MKLGIVGSRRRNSTRDYALLVDRVRALRPTMIISGGCAEGADKFAEKIAKDFGIPILIYHPHLLRSEDYKRWEVIEAMYARNEQIAMASEALIALVAEDRKGGTENTIGYFKKCKPTTWEESLEIL